MSFKEYMDRSGKFITEGDVEARVAQMQQSRAELLMRLQRDREETEKVAEMRRKAHEVDLKHEAEVDLKSIEVKKSLEDAWIDEAGENTIFYGTQPFWMFGTIQ